MSITMVSSFHNDFLRSIEGHPIGAQIREHASATGREWLLAVPALSPQDQKSFFELPLLRTGQEGAKSDLAHDTLSCRCS